MNWDDLRFFLVVARHRTLSAAARELSVAQPTVGRRVAALERQLGARLFIRRSDGLVLSDSGARVLAHAQRMEQDALAAERRVSGRDEGVRGVVRVTASEWLVSGVLAPLLPPLLARHRDLVVELISDQRHYNLARREADVALRPRRFEHDAVVQRAIGKLGFALYATRGYIEQHGSPAAGGGAGHVLIAMIDDVGDVARDWLAKVLPAATRSLRVNGRDAMLGLAVAGAGITCLARAVGDRVPELQRIAMSPEPPSPTLWLGIHQDARSTPRVRAVAAHISERLRAQRRRLCPAG